MIDANAARRSIGLWLVGLVLAAATAGCSTVKLVGDYDEQIDKGATALHKDIETFFVKLESSTPKPEGLVEAYQKNKQFYADAKVAVGVLRIRADATERNSLTVRMLDKIAANLDRLEEMHNSKDGLRRIELADLRGGFTTQFTALLTFELAKRRAEKPDESKANAPATKIASDKGEKK